jgi:hypothetical protein
MSTVTLSQPAFENISAEKALGIASQPLTTALPAAHAVFSLLGMRFSSFARRQCLARPHRHGNARSATGLAGRETSRRHARA